MMRKRLTLWSLVAITVGGCVMSARLSAQDSFAGVKAGEEVTQRPWFGTFCWCPAGKFKMGDEVREDALPLVEVTLTRGFWMGKYEVTQAQYQFVMDKNPSHFKGAFLPVEMVSWAEATAFCRRLTKLGRESGQLPRGWEYRLPSEAQWEYACRAGTTTRYPFGNDAKKLGDFAWYHMNSGTEEGVLQLNQLDRYAQRDLSPDEAIEISGRKTHPIGLKKPNRWGLCDMNGNVSEWCRDWYVRELPGGTDPEVTKETTERTTRGGSWCWIEMPLRSSVRRGLRPGPKMRSNTLGFRVAVVRTRQ